MTLGKSSKSSRPRLIIVCGLPGSGKTTLAKQLEKKWNAIRFCPDEWMEAFSIDLYDEKQRSRIEALQWKLGQDLLRQNVSIVIEWGTWAKSERDALRLGAKSLGAKVELHYLPASVDVLFDRIRRRGMENPPLKREDIAHWFNDFQAPSPEEMALFDRSVTIFPQER